MRRSQQHMRGLTLIELLVAMVIGLVIVLAAVAALTVARRGFNTVDAASQLRDSGRVLPQDHREEQRGRAGRSRLLGDEAAHRSHLRATAANLPAVGQAAGR